MPSAEQDTTDLTDPQHTLDPFTYFAKLRAESPVHWNTRHRGWFITRYQDVYDGYRDLRLSSNRLKPVRTRVASDKQESVGAALGLLERWMVFQDEPDHRRLRGIVHKAFTAHSVARLEDDIRSITEAEIDKLVARLGDGSGEPVEILSGFASNIPKAVICNMLGIRPDDHGDFVYWTEELSSFLGGIVIDLERNERAYVAVRELTTFLEDVIRRTSAESDNLMGQLVAAESEGQHLTREEVVATGILLLFGGRGTTASMISNGLRALILHPEQMERARSDENAIGPIVEEIFRWEGHTKLMPRIAGEDIGWHGREIKRGDRVFLCNTAANRDETVFPDPEIFDPSRPNVARHIAFGTGIHLCLGQALARLQLRIVLKELARRLPPLALVHPEGEWSRALLRRAQERLLVRAA